MAITKPSNGRRPITMNATSSAFFQLGSSDECARQAWAPTSAAGRSSVRSRLTKDGQLLRSVWTSGWSLSRF